MVHGTLEVLLIGAKGLENTDYLCTYEFLIFRNPSDCLLLGLFVPPFDVVFTSFIRSGHCRLGY